MVVDGIDFSHLWTWFLLTIRFGAMLIMLPGIGSDQVPIAYRAHVAMILAVVVVIAGIQSPVPDTMLQGGVIIFSQFLFGYICGFIPALIVAGVSVAGQSTAGAIGLSQASMIDPSLGESVTVIARIQSMIAVLIFVGINGHHIAIRAASEMFLDIGTNIFSPGLNTIELLTRQFSHSFEIALRVSAPIMVTILVTKFVLGLITKFVPQMNIFIIALPLTIVLGLYIIAFTFTGFTDLIVAEFQAMPEAIVQILASG